MNLCKYEEAVDDFQNALRLEPNHPEITTLLKESRKELRTQKVVRGEKITNENINNENKYKKVKIVAVDDDDEDCKTKKVNKKDNKESNEWWEELGIEKEDTASKSISNKNITDYNILKEK